MIRLYYYDISDISEHSSRYDSLYNNSAKCRKIKADRYRFFKDKCLCLAAGSLLSDALKDFNSGLTEDDVLLTEKGKPCFKDERLFFNLTHSGHLAACVMSDEGPVGIDAEEIAKARMDVATRFFSRGENDALKNTSTESERNLLFTELWTLKESCFKATGEGLSGNLASLDFSPYINQFPRFAMKEDVNNFCFEVSMQSDCCVSLCIMK